MRLFVAIPVPSEIGERLWTLTGGLPGASWMPPET
jgi:2'-5' RNA ligase